MKNQLLKPTQMGANDDQDMVVIRLGELKPRIPYQNALELMQSLRLGCMEAARYDRAPAKFWRELEDEDPRIDIPKVHRGFRRSMLAPNVSLWKVEVTPPLVRLLFDGRGKEFGYEDGIKLHILIRKAALRAKAWAGDTNTYSRMLGMLTNAEDDYRLNLI